jgi:hypothetical protein
MGKISETLGNYENFIHKRQIFPASHVWLPVQWLMVYLPSQTYECQSWYHPSVWMKPTTRSVQHFTMNPLRHPKAQSASSESTWIKHNKTTPWHYIYIYYIYNNIYIIYNNINIYKYIILYLYIERDIPIGFWNLLDTYTCWPMSLNSDIAPEYMTKCI